MFMSSILPTPLTAATLFVDESVSLFICVDVLVTIPEDSVGLSTQDANDVLPSAGISHQSVYDSPFRVIMPLRAAVMKRRRGEGAQRLPNLYLRMSRHLV